VLATWLVDLAEHEGGYAQTTSVPGVAQRTGATIYYVEVVPDAQSSTRRPVLALMPTPGDVDIVVASELMEAARAIQRGLVTPERTTLVASSHRVYTLVEKMAMGDGRVDTEQFIQRCQSEAKQVILRDFASHAERAGSVISATLFGALAGSGSLPWPRAAFEATIRRSGVGVEASLRAFDAAYRDVTQDLKPDPGTANPPPDVPAIDPRLADLWSRALARVPAAGLAVVRAGLLRAGDYQGPAYAGAYLDRVFELAELDRRHGDGSHRLLVEGARHLALWMTYEDTIRVAELKLRGDRFRRVGIGDAPHPAKLRHVEEYLHPRVEEVADAAPAAIGAWMLRSGLARAMLARVVGQGRVVRTSSLRGFLLLYAVASCRWTRPHSLRFQHETKAIGDWLARVGVAARSDYELACELAECPRVLKGYGETQQRGRRSFEAILRAVDALGPGAAAQVRQLRAAALADESGAKLARALEELGAPSHA
jgi:indolepyruvate ferredoxin oxidoreductase beta subunit